MCVFVVLLLFVLYIKEGERDEKGEEAEPEGALPLLRFHTYMSESW